jgi:protein-disulfide isomerase
MVVLVWSVFVTTAHAQSGGTLPLSRSDVEAIVKEYLLQNPEIVRDAFAELERRSIVAETEARRAALATHRSTLLRSARDAVLGNAEGDITLVEFFDYNCGYCRKSAADKRELLAKDTKLRIVLKEFPVLGPGSTEAARVSIAARMQGDARKFQDFHFRLLATRGQADQARALAVAKEVGLDVERIRKDMLVNEAGQIIDESTELANALGINGTPTYVVGEQLIVGAIGAAGLAEKISAERKRCQESSLSC